ncbi:Proton/sodium-glutamate symport protein [compost metagenome]
MDMARTALNVIGNALAVLVVSKWEGLYDQQQGERYWAAVEQGKAAELPLAGESAAQVQKV